MYFRGTLCIDRKSQGWSVYFKRNLLQILNLRRGHCNFSNVRGVLCIKGKPHGRSLYFIQFFNISSLILLYYYNISSLILLYYYNIRKLYGFGLAITPSLPLGPTLKCIIQIQLHLNTNDFLVLASLKVLGILNFFMSIIISIIRSLLI